MSHSKWKRTSVVLALVLVLGCGNAIPLNNGTKFTPNPEPPNPNVPYTVVQGTQILPIRFETPGSASAVGTWTMRVYVRGADVEQDDPVLANAGNFEFAETDPYPEHFVANTNADISGLSPGEYTLYVGKLNENDDVEGKGFELTVEQSQPLD